MFLLEMFAFIGTFLISVNLVNLVVGHNVDGDYLEALSNGNGMRKD